MADEHSTHSHAAGDHAHAGPNFNSYMMVFYVLSVFTAMSFLFNYMANSGWISHMTSATIIVGIAIIKASCVVAIFMNLRFDWGRVYCIIIPVSIMAVMMVIVLLPDIVLGWHHGLYTPPAHAQAIEGTPGH